MQKEILLKICIYYILTYLVSKNQQSIPASVLFDGPTNSIPMTKLNYFSKDFSRICKCPLYEK